MCERRYFKNPYPDYTAHTPVNVNKPYLTSLIKDYLRNILQNISSHDRGDLYVGNAGIAYMMLKLHQCSDSAIFLTSEITWNVFNDIRKNSKKYAERKNDRSSAFLCGAAGIHMVSAAILDFKNEHVEEKQEDLLFLHSVLDQVCSSSNPDEILVGKAGFLSGILWLNQQIEPKPFSSDFILQICQKIVDSGRAYSHQHHSPFPLMYAYHNSEYLGAAHGLSGILLMLLQSPWFEKNNANEFSNISTSKFDDIKRSIDGLLEIQDAEGNFPTKLKNSDKKLLHWCHGVPGVIYLAAKSFLVFGDDKYLRICERGADTVWAKGLLYKGPGICHGVAGNGYVHLLMYRLTKNPKYLYRAIKFAEFLGTEEFDRHATTPDRPFSLYEGLSGTVCFLLDLIDPEKAAFPFMNVFM